MSGDNAPTHTWGVFHADTRNVNEVAVLAVLLAYAQRHGVAWPSQSTIARRAKLSRSSVARALKELERRQVIAREQPVSGQAVRWIFPATGAEPKQPKLTLRRADIEKRRLAAFVASQK